LPQELTSASDLDEDIRRVALESFRTEHQDFHFAQDLSRMTSDDERLGRSNTKAVVQPQEERKTKDEKVEGEGIARFFSKQ